MDLLPEVIQGLADAGYTEPTPVQEETLTHAACNGRDITVQSQTGTGKTAAFLLPVYQLVCGEGRFKGAKTLILSPTRELAVQIAEEAQLLGSHLGLKYGCVYGGVGYGAQEAMLKEGVDILVGTPGRLLDFVGSKKINMREFKILVIDEADRLMDMGFFPDMKKIFKMMVPREDRLTMLLSATISSHVSQLTWEYMNEPVEIAIKSDNVTVDAIEQGLFHVARDEKMALLLGIFKKYNPKNALVFCNTKRMSEEVAKRLELNGIPTAFIMGDLPQSKRLKIIQDIKDGKVRFLVATDVAARGLHIDALELVVNYDLPEDAENYVHRIGRTARAGAKGRAITLACERDVYHLPAIEKYIAGKIPLAEFSEELLVEDVSRGQRIHLSTWDDEGDRQGGRNGHAGPSRDGRGRSSPRYEGRGENRGPRGEHGPGAGPARPFRERTESAGPRLPEGPRPERKPFDKPRSDPRPHEAPRGERREKTGPKPVPAGSGVEARLAYYRQKYGEGFEVTPELLNRLKSEEAAATRRRQEKSGSGERQNQTGKKQSGHTKAAQGTRSAGPQKGAQQPAKGQSPRSAEQEKNTKKTTSGGLFGWLKRAFGKE